MSILIIGPVGRWRGVEPRAKVSMMTMRPPQHGQGYDRLGGTLGSEASALGGTLWDFATMSSSRARATLSAQEWHPHHQLAASFVWGRMLIDCASRSPGVPKKGRAVIMRGL